MEIQLTTNATLGLLNQVARKGTDPDMPAFQATGDAAQMSGQAGAANMLMIRDTLTQDAYVYGFISVSDEAVAKLGNFLSDIRDKEIALAQFAEGSATHTQLLGEKQALEESMSVYVGGYVHGSFDMQAGISNTASQNSFFDVVNIYNDPGSDQDLAGMLSIIEVEMDTVFQNAHDTSTCPHCIAKNKAAAALQDPFQKHEVNYTTSTAGAASASASSDNSIESLRMGTKWTLGEGDTLSYSFFNDNVGYKTNYANGDTGIFSSASDIEAINDYGSDNETGLRSVMAEWDKAVSFDFTEITEAGSDVGEIRFAWTDGGTSGGSGGRAAFAYGPGSFAESGDVWFETFDIDVAGDNSDFDPTGTGDDGFSYFAALHEVGHALGLSHPFGNSSASGTSLSVADDTIRNSVMSYTQIDRNTIVDFDGFGNNQSYRVYSSTPMVFDVMAMEHLYGKEATSDGDTTYTFANDSVRNQPIMLKTLIDTGGTDTIDASNQTRSNTIDLNPGSFSSIGEYSVSDQVNYWATTNGWTVSSVQAVFDSYDTQAQSASNGLSGAYAQRKGVYTGEDNLGIAHNATIENAKGGSAGDTISGNSVGNKLEGLAGNDTLDGRGGNDTLIGGMGDDTITGGDGDEDVAVYTGDRNDYTITEQSDGSFTVADGTSGRDGTDSLTSVEFLQFEAGSASAQGASIRTSSVTASDMTGSHQIGIEVDGGPEVIVTFTGRDYSSAPLSLSDFASDMQTAINNALTAAGLTSSVSVHVNSPLTIVSDDTSSNSAISITSLSADLQAALGNITEELAIQVGDTVYYDLGGGFVTTTQPGNTPLTQNPAQTANIVTVNGGLGPSTSSGGGTGGGTGGSGGGGGTPQTQNNFTGNGLGGTGLPNLNQISVLTQEDTVIAIAALDRAINQISQNQAKLGAAQNRLERNIDNLQSQMMQTEMAMGRIVDTDFAAETAKLVKDQILQQAAMQAMGMALDSQQGVMSLLN